jgi:hypothetical protein
MSEDVEAEKRGSERWLRCAVAAEVNGRRVNEAIERGAIEDGAAVFVCECGHLGCSTTIPLSIADYEAVRTNFDRFLVFPGHEIDQVDRVVERHPDHVVVVKREGEARQMVAASDERPR